MPRPLTSLLLCILLGALAWTVQEPDPDARALEEARLLQEALDQRAGRLAEDAAHNARLIAENGPSQWMHQQANVLEQQRLRTGTVLFGFINDSLVCWSGQLPADAVAMHLDTAAAQRQLPDAIYLHAQVVVGSLAVHALCPVWITPSIENKYVQRTFHSSLKVPKGLIAQPWSASGPLLKDASGAPLLRVAWRDDAMDSGPWIILRLLLMLLSALFAIIAGWTSVQRYLDVRNINLRIILFLSFLVALRWSVLLFIPSAPFDRLPLFDPATYAASFAFPSLGDLVINAVLLVLAMAFVRRESARAARSTLAFHWVPLTWGGLLVAAAWVTDTIIGLVNDSRVDLDLYHVQSLNGTSAAAVSAIALLFIFWLLLADLSIRRLILVRPAWAVRGVGAAAVLASILLHHWYGVRDTALFLWPVPLLTLIAHIHHDRPRFIHAILGIGTLAGLTSHVLTKYTREREHRERLVLAERLSVKEDPVVEVLFREVAPQLRSDGALHRLITANGPCAAGELDAAVRQVFFGSFWERYDVRVFAFDAEGRARCSADGQAPRSLERISNDFTEPTALADMPDLFFEQGAPEGPYYHARLVVMPDEGAVPGQLVIEMHPRSTSQGMGFPELLLSGEEPIARRTERYAIARYERGILADRANARGVPLFWTRDLGTEGQLWYVDRGMEYLARGLTKGTVLVLGLPTPTFLDNATTFSYLFALFSVLLSIVVLARDLLRSRGIPALGIGAKVRAALLLFAVTSLVFFGAGARHLLARQYEQRAEAGILEKARSAHAELQQKLNGGPSIDQEHSRYLEHLLADLSSVLFTDINVYDLRGRLIASSRPQVFSTGLLGPRMDAVAYARMAVLQASDFVHQESIGSALYRSAYMPLRDRNGTVMGYLSLPSFADQRQQEQERSGVLVAVVNLFVLLFALSVLVALFISNWTTRPLDLLKRSLSAVDLQGENKPLTYRGKDELGQLVEVYNRKVEELRESAEKLARSERESAWKEMARQVAHEIKNPLTPMKLGIQHFQHTWDPNAPDAKAKLDRFTSSMVEQIDVLSRVAGDFSRFAQLSAARETVLDLNEVARSVVVLFAGEQQATISLNTAPRLLVKADREHLVRVLNNLIKNALQSIPDGRNGQVDVVLKQEGADALIEVRDNGIGITEADRARIFTPSFTTKSSGTGLGLAMVKRMVEQAGGKVWFITIEGVGTSFFVSLPLHT